MLPGLKLGKFSSQEVEHRAMEKLRMLGMESLALKMRGRYQAVKNNEWPLPAP